MNSFLQCTGRTEEHLQQHPVEGCLLHSGALADFCALQSAAKAQGFDLRVASAFRSFERQLSIWNAKALGQRAVLDEGGRVLEPGQLSRKELVYAILRWSALPGASRHHWGTDLDIYDAAAIKSHESVQLIPDEYQNGGPFEPMHRWLQQAMQEGAANGFIHVYGLDRGGVAPEPWHISYAPLALEFQRVLSVSRLETLIKDADIALKETILTNLDDIYQRFIVVPPEAYQQEI